MPKPWPKNSENRFTLSKTSYIWVSLMMSESGLTIPRSFGKIKTIVKQKIRAESPKNVVLVFLEKNKKFMRKVSERPTINPLVKVNIIAMAKTREMTLFNFPLLMVKKTNPMQI